MVYQALLNIAAITCASFLSLSTGSFIKNILKNMQDNIYKDALPRLAEGIRKATAIVAPTMGPKGTNVTIESKSYPYSQTTNDGATIIKEIVLADTVEKIGLSHLQQAADRSNANSGDGSTTTCVLLNAILEEGLKSGIHSLEIKQSLDECLPIIEQSISDQTKQITVDDIPAVARIAGESEELAQTLGEIYQTIGADGIVHLEGSGTYKTSFSLIEGVRFIDTGFLSPYMANEGKKAHYKKPTILVTKNKIEHFKDIDPILQALIQRGDKTLVIFTDDMDSNVARALIELQNNEKRSINVLIIKAPVLWKAYVFEDFAKVTGATIIEDASGTLLGNKFRLDWLGTCDTLMCDKDETTVIGIQDISEHVTELEKEGTQDAKLRLSWLTTKTAILKLGAKSETELRYLMLKAEDAIHSSRLALKHGVVAGGGVALLNAVSKMPDSIGGSILMKALMAPAVQIVTNARGNVEDIQLHVRGEGTVGYNAKTGEFVDMFEAGIVDSSAIVLGAIRNALGIASTLLTTSSVLVLPPKSAAELANQQVMRPAYF